MLCCLNISLKNKYINMGVSQVRLTPKEETANTIN